MIRSRPGIIVLEAVMQTWESLLHGGDSSSLYCDYRSLSYLVIAKAPLSVVLTGCNRRRPRLGARVASGVRYSFAR
jgi:hypothetical protein